MWWNIFIQALGFIAIGVNLIAVQFNTHGKIMLFKTLGSFLFALQYLLLGAYAGMVMDLIGTIRNIVFTYNVKNNKSNKWWIILFAIVTLILGLLTIILTWEKSILAVSHWSTDLTIATTLAVGLAVISIIAKLLTTVAYGFKDPHKIRLTNYPSSSLWLIYNFACFSIAGMVNEIMTLISLTIAEIRFRKPKETVEKK